MRSKCLSVACQSTPVPIMSSPALSSVTGQEELFRAIQGRCQKQKTQSPPAFCLLPAVPGHSGPPDFTWGPQRQHTHTHTHTHTEFTSSVQPAALWGHCWIWVHGSLSSIAFPGLTEEKKVASSNPSSWQDPEIADFSPNLVFTPSCIGLCWKLFSC